MRVNEIFYSLQGEGAHAGTAAIFVRFSGCNLKCDFCDTNHESYKDMTDDEIVREIAKYPAKMVVITGGEPSLQLTSRMIAKIHEIGKIVAIETNGTRPIPSDVDWVTVSPKAAYLGETARIAIDKAQEVKIVIDDRCAYTDPTFGITAAHYFIQPCDTGDEIRNKEIIDRCIKFVKKNPSWRLSIQTQKILNVR